MTAGGTHRFQNGNKEGKAQDWIGMETVSILWSEVHIQQTHFIKKKQKDTQADCTSYRPVTSWDEGG